MKPSLCLSVMITLITLITHVFPPQQAFAQSYPSKAIRLIIPYTPGGASDNVARPLAQKLTEGLGAPVVVDNRGGAGTMIGADIVAKAPADGYTLLLCSVATHAASPQLYRHVPYDPFKDFEPITLIATSPTILIARKMLRIGSVNDLVQAAKANPDKFTSASGGVGSPGHLATELFTSIAGITLLHVPFKGGGASIAEMYAERIDLQFTGLPTAIPSLNAGRLKAIAIAGESRWPDLSDVPTFAESGWPQFQSASWFGLCAPARTPKAIIDQVGKAALEALASSDFRQRLRLLGGNPGNMSSREFAAFIRADYDKYGKIIKRIGVRMD